ncbi:ABC transporter permease [Halostagnicola bangensis]
MSKIQYYIRRLFVTVLLIFGVVSFLFIAFRLMPGDYATTLAGGGASSSELEEIRESWGLNEPLYMQYYHYMANMVTGDPGTSHVSNEPVLSYVRAPLMNSLILVIPAIIVAFTIGSIYGALLGTKSGTAFERYGILPPTLAGTTPNFFIGILLLLIFSSALGWFPVGGMAGYETYAEVESHYEIYLTTDFWSHYVLPFTTIVLTFLYYPALIMRGSVIDVKGQEYTYFQRIAGLPSKTRFKHLMKHSSLPVITLLPAQTATAISGLVLIETVFNWPGIGTLLFDSVLSRDTPVIQFLFIIVAIWIIFGNLIVDIFYTVIDPRITIED